MFGIQINTKCMTGAGGAGIHRNRINSNVMFTCHSEGIKTIIHPETCKNKPVPSDYFKCYCTENSRPENLICILKWNKRNDPLKLPHLLADSMIIPFTLGFQPLLSPAICFLSNNTTYAKEKKDIEKYVKVSCKMVDEDPLGIRRISCATTPLVTLLSYLTYRPQLRLVRVPRSHSFPVV